MKNSEIDVRQQIKLKLHYVFYCFFLNCGIGLYGLCDLFYIGKGKTEQGIMWEEQGNGILSTCFMLLELGDACGFHAL